MSSTRPSLAFDIKALLHDEERGTYVQAATAAVYLMPGTGSIYAMFNYSGDAKYDADVAISYTRHRCHI